MGTTSAISRLRQIDDVIASFIDRRVIAGAVTLVAGASEIVHLSAQGYVDLASGRPMRPDSIFRLASLTKPVTSAAILALLDERKLALTDPLSAFLPMFKTLQVDSGGGLVPAAREITLSDLLTHTAGLGASPKPPLLAHVAGGLRANSTLAEVVPRMASVPLQFQPGTAFAYSPELGFDVLGRVIEIVSGQTLDEFLRRRIFAPLGAHDVFFHVPAARLCEVATPYKRAPNGLAPARPTAVLALSTVPESSYHSGSAGLVGTAGAFARFAMMLANDGQLDGQRVLCSGAVALMTANHVGGLPLHSIYIDLRGYHFGLGVRVLDNPALTGSLATPGTFGWAGAFGTQMWVDPAKRLVSLLFVQRLLDPEDAALRDLPLEIEKAIYQALAA